MNDDTLTKSYVPSPKTVERLVLVSPPDTTGLQQVIDDSGFKQFLTAQDFRVLTLVADATFQNLRAGDTVFVPSEMIVKADWSKKLMSFMGSSAIVVPVEAIVAFERK